MRLDGHKKADERVAAARNNSYDDVSKRTRLIYIRTHVLPSTFAFYIANDSDTALRKLRPVQIGQCARSHAGSSVLRDSGIPAREVPRLLYEVRA